MNTHKIFKSYFAFICIISAVAMMTSNDAFNDSFVSVFHAVDATDSLIGDTIHLPEQKYQIKTVNNTAPVNLFMLANESDFIKISNTDNSKNGVEVVHMMISTKNIADLTTLQFKVEGLSIDKIKNARLFLNDNIISGLVNPNSNILFKDINSKLKPGKSNLSVRIELEKNISTGTQFRLLIDTPDSIIFKNKDSAPNTFYPILGKYITIVSSKN